MSVASVLDNMVTLDWNGQVVSAYHWTDLVPTRRVVLDSLVNYHGGKTIYYHLVSLLDALSHPNDWNVVADDVHYVWQKFHGTALWPPRRTVS